MKRFLLILFFLFGIYFLLYKIYIPRVSAFGCFDDCFSFAAGYFINHNKVLYSEIFYNHQLLPAYLSSSIQTITQPINIFDLVLKHRQFIMLFGFLFNFLLIFRFGLPALLFTLFFEFSKFYIFGDRFLGETILVYPLVLLVFISWKKLKSIKLSKLDFFLSVVSAWLIIYLRETFIPLSLVLLLYVFLPLNKQFIEKKQNAVFFLVIVFIPLIFLNLKDYYFNLLEVNKVFFAQSPFDLTTLFYPISILLSNKWNLFRYMLVGVDILFLISFLYLILLKRKFSFILLLIPLILANIRVVTPGQIFYESFHMVPFYGIFLGITFLLIFELRKYNKLLWSGSLLAVLILFVYFTASPQIFFRDKINQQEEFITNYGNILQVGSVIKKISTKNSTLFVDGFDEEVYWVADRPSSYRYSVYTSFMPDFKKYSDARLEMFRKSPPDFYYGSCPKEKNSQRLMPSESIPLYIRLDAFDKPSCVFVKRNLIKNITSGQWNGAKEFGYTLPLE